jgi:predicted alpha/beta hydrolase family esterase
MAVLVLPGYGDSGPEHWQTRWEARYGYARVVQDDWERPRLEDWMRRLGERVAAVDEPIVLAAHSLGCILAAHAAASPFAPRIAGALLVAPADVDEIRHLLPEVESFAPVPTARLPFPAIVVASTEDPYVEPVRARTFAAAWGARLVELAGVGHVNAESNLGAWDAGHRLLEELLGTVGGR